MKIEDLRKLSENDLKSRLIDNMESLQKYRFQKSIQQLEDYKLISEMKKENAKINTLLNELSGKDRASPSISEIDLLGILFFLIFFFAISSISGDISIPTTFVFFG